MGILRKLGATATALTVLATGLLATALPADAAATAAPAAAPAAATSTTAASAATEIVPGRLRLDRRCMTGRIICLNKTTRKIVFMIDGRVQATGDVRFGCVATPTRNGMFKVYYKSRNHVSSIYRTPMPYAMFFSGGQAVHYSPDFRARGYNGCSHGCANMRDKNKIAWLFARVKIGDKVLVYKA